MIYHEHVTPSEVSRTFIADGSPDAILPAYAISYAPGGKIIDLEVYRPDDVHGFDPIVMRLDAHAIRELRDELSAVIWYWGEHP